MAKIKITISGKSQELSVKEAEALYDELHCIFGKTVVVKERVTIPIYHAPAPIVIQPSPSLPPWWGGHEITCGTQATLTNGHQHR